MKTERAKLILLIAYLLIHSSSNGQSMFLGNEIIDADMRVDSLFQRNFELLEQYEQTFTVKNPGFSMIDFYEPCDEDLYGFVALLVEVSGIKCDSTIQQKDWNREYCIWDDVKIEDWQKWYMKNGGNLNWEEIVMIKNKIEKNRLNNKINTP